MSQPPRSSAPSPSPASSAAQERQPALAWLCAQHQVAPLYAFGSRGLAAFDWLRVAEDTFTLGDSESIWPCFLGRKRA